MFCSHFTVPTCSLRWRNCSFLGRRSQAPAEPLVAKRDLALLRKALSCICFVLLLPLFAVAAGAVELGIDKDQFTLDGRPTFLLGCSYYAGLGAPERALGSDLDQLHRLGFNWIRVFATWSAFEADLMAVDGASGAPREPYIGRLVRLVEECNRRGMIVDVTLTRGDGAQPCLMNLAAHQRAVQSIAAALRQQKNWYIDLGNERNVGDRRFVPVDQLPDLVDSAKQINPRLLVTASHAGDPSQEELEEYLLKAKLDFISIHRPRDADSPANTKRMTGQCREWMKQISRVVPIQYDEPFRRDYGTWQPRAADFRADLQAARGASAAGWCFHNGANNSAAPESQPRRSFDLRNSALFEQLDEEERTFLSHLSSP